jgi:3-dehydroquinate synthase
MIRLVVFLAWCSIGIVGFCPPARRFSPLPSLRLLAEQKVDVQLQDRSYPIYIQPNLISDCSTVLRSVTKLTKNVLVISNEVVAPLYLQKVRELLVSGGISVHTVILSDGESHKTMDSVLHILNSALTLQLDRQSIFIALGGGVVGDIAGFAAAIFQRGVQFVQIPTTLLAMVDSSVGGKTGVNHPLGKNMIGSFHQPIAVLADLNMLNTLPQREYLSAFSEIIKYGIIYDEQFFTFLEENIEDLVLRQKPSVLQEVVRRCCAIKAAIVALDERERSDTRALLNLGHTFGHAIETATGHDGSWLHGEAVAVGVMMAVKLAHRLEYINNHTAMRIEKLLKRCQLPTKPLPDMSVDEVLHLMQRDKKVSNGRLKLVLPKDEVGHAVVTDNFDITILREILSQFCSK